MFKILLAETRERNPELVRQRLPRARIVQATDGWAAVELARRERPDLILLELGLPGPGGSEVIRRLQEDAATNAIPLIGLADPARPGERQHALDLGCDDCADRPLGLDALIERVENYLRLQRAVQEAMAVTPGPGYSVLIVDADRVWQRWVRRVLEAQGHHVHTATTGAAAFDLLRMRPVDLVLLDADVPHPSGFEVLQEIRAGQAPQDLVVILLSGRQDPEDAATALSLGANDFLAKPADLPLLLARIQTHLIRKRPQAAVRAAAPAVAVAPVGGWEWAVGDPAPPPPPRAALPAPVAIASGTTLAGYTVVEEVGRGAHGVVYRAWHGPTNRPVALKVIRADRMPSGLALRRYYREVQTAARFHHPRFASPLDAGQLGDLHYFVTEFVEGVDLDRRVKQDGPLSLKDTCIFLRQAAQGLQYAHERGMIHRGIKPTNLIVSGGGAEAAVKILDLGLALPPGAEAGEAAAYLAPEQRAQADQADGRADLYGLGGTAYYLLAGQAPAPDEPEPLEQIRPGLPPPVTAVIRKLMARRPENRFLEAAELAAALEPYIRGPFPGLGAARSRWLGRGR